MVSAAAAWGGWVAALLSLLAAAVACRALRGGREAVARASHELRGPLAAARLGLELGARAGELSSARLRAIELELARAALALEDLSESEGRSSTLRSVDSVDAERLLADSVEAWRAGATARGVRLGVCWSGGPGFVWGDRLRLAQATGNLIANAIEHGGGVVEVSGKLDGGRVRIEVIDSGAGLPAPVLELARKPRAGKGTRGRGLAIASAVAASHGGRLAAAPAERGARLVLELPAAPTPPFG
jgi:signal transduction histidine kinase